MNLHDPSRITLRKETLGEVIVRALPGDSGREPHWVLAWYVEGEGPEGIQREEQRIPHWPTARRRAHFLATRRLVDSGRVERIVHHAADSALDADTVEYRRRTIAPTDGVELVASIPAMRRR